MRLPSSLQKNYSASHNNGILMEYSIMVDAIAIVNKVGVPSSLDHMHLFTGWKVCPFTCMSFRLSLAVAYFVHAQPLYNHS